MPGSPAEKAGIKAGDEIIEVAGDSSRLDFSDIMMAAVLSGKEKAIPLKVRRADGTIDDISLVAEAVAGRSISGLRDTKTIYADHGKIAPRRRQPVV